MIFLLKHITQIGLQHLNFKLNLDFATLFECCFSAKSLLTFMGSFISMTYERINSNTQLALRPMNPQPNISTYPVCIEDGGGKGGKSGFE